MECFTRMCLLRASIRLNVFELSPHIWHLKVFSNSGVDCILVSNKIIGPRKDLVAGLASHWVDVLTAVRGGLRDRALLCMLEGWWVCWWLDDQRVLVSGRAVFKLLVKVVCGSWRWWGDNIYRGRGRWRGRCKEGLKNKEDDEDNAGGCWCWGVGMLGEKTGDMLLILLLLLLLLLVVTAEISSSSVSMTASSQ